MRAYFTVHLTKSHWNVVHKLRYKIKAEATFRDQLTFMKILGDRLGEECSWSWVDTVSSNTSLWS